MKKRALAVLGVIGGASGAWAQPQTQGTITYTLTAATATQAGGSWTNAATIGAFGSNVNITGPNQGVLFRITMLMTPPAGDPLFNLGGPLTWNPSIQAGSSGTGSNAGFWSGDINLTASGAPSDGTWSDGTGYSLSVRTRLLTATAGNTGSATATGNGRTDIQPAQFNADAEGINHGTSYVVFQGMWIPSFLTMETRFFNLSLGSLGLLSSLAAADSNYDNGYTLPVPLRVATEFGPGVIMGIPAPAGVVLLAAVAMGAGRRRRPQ